MIHRGRIVRAFAVGARAGAEWRHGRPLNEIVRQHVSAGTGVASPHSSSTLAAIYPDVVISGVLSVVGSLGPLERGRRDLLHLFRDRVNHAVACDAYLARAILDVPRSGHHLDYRRRSRRHGHTRQPVNMLSNKSLERTVNHPGRPVRAVALCARAGAEIRSWPAVQRNR